ncbi:MAG TPA: hypothetical protein VJN48_10120 [Terriglobales bacterium]|nr:hypothetical protein [Terriglobales bacterium]
MRRFRWAILIGELVLLALALAAPRMDLPQTAFNEADTPVNQATSVVVLGCRSALTGLRAAASTPSAGHRIRHTHPAVAADLQPQQSLRSRSLLALLCALLC